MRIAVAYDNDMIFQHFGHCKQLKLYDTDNGTILQEQAVYTMGQGHGALTGFLAKWKVDAVICGGIGGCAQTALAQAGMQLFGVVHGNTDEAVRALRAGSLAYSSSANRNHRSHGEHNCYDHNSGGHCIH